MTLSPSLTFPKLRAVDVRPHSQNGHAYYLLRDPLELQSGSLLIPQYLGPVLALCDGSMESSRALGSTLLSRYGIGLETEQINEVLAALDQACLLENERARVALVEKIQRFRRQPFRTPSLAGLSYPAERAALARLLDDYLTGISPRNRYYNGHTNGHGHRVGVFSPHIDYPRGGKVYAQTWGALGEAARAADLVIILGTDHYGDDLFTLTRQHYATPYGTLPTATALVDDLAAVLGEDAAFAGELRHSNEHSLELVAVWLHHMRGGDPVPILPVLTGSLHHLYGSQQSPADNPFVFRFLEAVRRHVQGRNVLVVASGDLSHVGPAFGGQPLTAQDRLQVQSADRTLINHLCQGDAEGFFNAIRRIRNRHNVCGGTPGYLALKLLDGLSGTETGYQSCPADEQNQSAVTIGGVVFQ